jgi:hypothetical protein
VQAAAVNPDKKLEQSRNGERGKLPGNALFMSLFARLHALAWQEQILYSLQHIDLPCGSHSLPSNWHRVNF